MGDVMRKFLLAASTLALGVLGLVAVPGVASASATPVPLLLPQGTAFAILGHSCGGIQETSATTGFDPASGYPTGEVGLSTRCGGSGRGGGYHTTTYTSSADVTWDLTGAVVTYAVPASGLAVPGFSATDAFGNQVYDSGSSAFLALADGFVPAPRLVAVSVTEGPASGGTVVTLTGTGFTGATQVDFGSTPAASFTVSGDTSMTAVAPAAPAGTVDITVVGPGGTSATSPSDRFTLVAAPTVTGLSPATGPLNGGTQVTITGTGFTGATQVAFGGVPALFGVDSDSQLTATAPAGDAVDVVTVTVTTAGGTSAGGPAAAFSYTASSPCGSGCAITSPPSAAATAGTYFSITVTTTGGVTPVLTARGRLPGGVTFVDNGDGTATLSGVPGPLGRHPAAGTYKVKVKATFAVVGQTKVVKQTLVLTVT
jgi:hypothetical protein